MVDKVEKLSVSKEGLSLESASLNTILTMLAVAGIVGLGVWFYKHDQNSTEAQKTMVVAVEKMAAAMLEANAIHRETNCLMGYNGPPAERADFCRRLRQ